MTIEVERRVGIFDRIVAKREADRRDREKSGETTYWKAFALIQKHHPEHKNAFSYNAAVTIPVNYKGEEIPVNISYETQYSDAENTQQKRGFESTITIQIAGWDSEVRIVNQNGHFRPSADPNINEEVQITRLKELNQALDFISDEVPPQCQRSVV